MDNLGRQSDDTGFPCPCFSFDGSSVQVLQWKTAGEIDHLSPWAHDPAGNGNTEDADKARASNRSFPSCLGHQSEVTTSALDLATDAPLHGGEPEALPALQGAEIRPSAAASHLINLSVDPTLFSCHTVSSPPQPKESTGVQDPAA